jgi:signal transduction histidine kinase
MARLIIVAEFLRSKAGRSFLLLVLASAVLALIVGVGFHNSNMRWFQANKGEETITTLELVDAFVAVYSNVRGAHSADEMVVPASFRAHALARFNRERDSASSLRVVMVGPPGREIVTPPSDADMASTIQRFSSRPSPKAETRFVTIDGELLLRTISPSIASQQSCVDCHNQLHQGWQVWKLNDVVGAFVVDIPAGDFVSESLTDSIEAGLLVFLVCAGAALYLCVLHFRRQREDSSTISALRTRERELDKAREDAQAANRTKSQFLANMSHELRTPLNAIIGFSEIISKDLLQVGRPPEYRDYARDINSSGQNLLQIINDILDMSKIDAGKLDLREDVFDVGAAVAHCVRMIGGRAHEAGVLVSNELTADLPRLRADPVRFKQIALNLLSNAVKFTPGPGSVRIFAQLGRDGSFALAISDTGIGMSPDELEIAMQPFRQIDSDLARKHEGTGLGLPLTKALVELHDGVLQIRSNKGRGTEVSVVLPPERVVPAAPAFAA